MKQPRFQIIDLSAEVYGKYQYCTKDRKSGLWYADSDFEIGGGLRRGSLPSPSQDTSELRETARKMHEAAAQKLMADVLPKRSAGRTARVEPAAALPIVAALVVACLAAIILL